MSNNIKTKTLKVQSTIGSGDLDRKVSQVSKWLDKDLRVDFHVMLRGRLNDRPDMALDLINSIIAKLGESARVEAGPNSADSGVRVILSKK